MSLVYEDRVKETTISTGTGALTLAGAATGFRAFSAVLANADTCIYCIDDNAGAWEVGVGTYATSGNTLTRTTIIRSSNSNAAVSFGSGTKDVFLTLSASRVVTTDEATNDFGGNTINNATLKNPRDLWQSITHSASGALTVDFDNGYNVAVAQSANITSIVWQNVPLAGSFLLEITKDNSATARSIVWTSFVWFNGGSAPTMPSTALAVSAVPFYTRDTGSTFRASPLVA